MRENAAYQDEFLEELIDGKLVAMSPAVTNHNVIADNINFIFKRHLKGKPCRPFGDGEALYLTEDDVFIPDGMIVCDRSKIKSTGVYGPPDLVVEILSPGTARNDKGHKKDVYESSGVAEYWIVSPNERSVEVYLLQGGRYVLKDVYTQYPDWMLEDMSEDKRAGLVTQFKCHLYDDLLISLDEIFEDLV